MKCIPLLSAAILVSFLLVFAGCGTKTATPVPDPANPAVGTEPAAPAVQPVAPAAPAAQEYTCPMHPEVRATQPGQCPKCGMNLVPVAKPSAAAPNASGGCACCGQDPA